MSLDNFRSKYPGAYDDMPDNELADRVYDKFYRHLDREDYNQKMGIAPTIVEDVADFSTAPESYKPAPFETPPEDSALTVIKKSVSQFGPQMQATAGGAAQALGESFEGERGLDVEALRSKGVADDFDDDDEFASAYEQVNVNRAAAGQQPVDPDMVSGSELITQAGQRTYQAGTEEAQQRAPVVEPGSPKAFLGDVVNATTMMLPSILIGAMTRNPNVALGVMFPQVYGQDYAARREKGLSPEEASLEAMAVSSSEILTEKIPLDVLLKPGSKILKKILLGSAFEGAQEWFQAGIEEFIDQGILREGMTMGEAWEVISDPEVQKKMAWQAGVGAGMGATLGTGIGAVEAVTNKIGGGKNLDESNVDRETFIPTAPQEPTPDEIQAQEQGEAGRDLKEFIDDSRPTDEVLAERKESRAQEAAQAEAEAQAEELDAALEQAVEEGEIEQELAEVAPEVISDQIVPEQAPIGDQTVTEGTGERTDPVKAETPQDVDVAAIQAEPEPTEAQIESGNYKKGHLKLHGLDITIENARGDMRRGTDQDGETWEVQMPAHYGYVKRTEGADGEHVDVYIGENTESKQIFIVDQVDPKTGKFDEHKIVMGTQSVDQAADLYQAGFSDNTGADRMGAISRLSITQFRQWLKNGKTKKAFNYQVPEQVADALSGQRATLWGNIPAHVRQDWAVEAGLTKKQAQTMAGRDWTKIKGKAKSKLETVLNEKIEQHAKVQMDEKPAPAQPIKDVAAKTPEPEQAHPAPVQPAEKPAEAVIEAKPEERRAEPAEGKRERREDTGKRKHVDEMTAEEKDAEIEFLRTHDLLTGLHNYEAFKNDKAFGKHVAFFDLDDFKTTNDTLGHALADDILKSTANYLSQKNSDSVRFYRRSGDEFLARFKDEEAAKMHMRMTQDTLGNTPFVMQYLDEETNQTIRIAGKGVGLSYGIGKSEQTAEKQADADKARRKQAGQRRGERDAIERSGEARKSPEPETPVSEVQPEITPAAEPTAVLDLKGNPIPSGLMIEVKYDIVDTGETGTATVPAAETMAELRAKQDTYKQLQDCLS